MEFQRARRLWWPILVFFASLGPSSQTTHAQADRDTSNAHPKYTLATICGNYSAIATYGANIARALGTETMDGQGNLTGSAIVNQPGPNNTRTITSIGLAGTYTVNSDGTGKMVLTVTLQDGSSASVTEDFLITKVKVVDGVRIASEIQDAQEVPSAVIEDSSLVIHSYSLRSVPRSCRAGQ
jgi:hypothetical protein